MPNSLQMKKYILFGILYLAISAKAQLPETRIYTLDITNNRNILNFQNLQLVSNNKGYNNQPFFTNDGKYLLYSSNNGEGNTDIYRYQLGKKSALQFWQKRNNRITNTPEAEYSPRLKPDETEITCVRVESDTVTQAFYGYNIKGKLAHKYLPDVKNIGYYTWLNNVDIIAFTLPEPFLLSKFNTITLKQDTIASSPGRTFAVHKGKVYFVDKATIGTDSSYAIRQVAPFNLRSSSRNKTKIENPIIAYTMPLQEDFVILNDGTFLMGNANKLYAVNPKKAAKNVESTWKEIADFSTLGIKNFYRLATNADNSKLALVTYQGEKP